LVKARYFSQPNLLAGREVVPELLQEAVTPERLASEVERWLDHPEEVAKLVDTFGEIHETLRRGASERAADAVLALLESRRLPECP
jgi:lipid-A-disaccharide synthase